MRKPSFGARLCGPLRCSRIHPTGVVGATPLRAGALDGGSRMAAPLYARIAPRCQATRACGPLRCSRIHTQGHYSPHWRCHRIACAHSGLGGRSMPKVRMECCISHGAKLALPVKRTTLKLNRSDEGCRRPAQAGRPAKALRWAHIIGFADAPRFCPAKSTRPQAASEACLRQRRSSLATRGSLRGAPLKLKP